MEHADIDTLHEFLAEPVFCTSGIFARFACLKGAALCGDGLKQYCYVPGTRSNRVLLVAHADTYWDNHYQRGNSPVGIGADDRAGCAILWQMRGLGHSLLVTSGEERSNNGARHAAETEPELQDHQFVVEFDRRGSHDYKCYEVGTDPFRKYVEQMTGYSEPDRWSGTDIVAICRDICGVNLSVGYYHEHTTREYIDESAWTNTLRICRKWLSAPELPRFVL